MGEQRKVSNSYGDGTMQEAPPEKAQRDASKDIRAGSSKFVVDQLVKRAAAGSAMAGDPGRFTASGKSRSDPGVVVLPFANDGFKGNTRMGTGLVELNPEAQPFTLAHEMRHRMQAQRAKESPAVDATYRRQELQMKTVLDSIVKRGVELKLPGFSGDTREGELEGQLAAYASTLPAGKTMQESPLLKGADPTTQVVLLRMLEGRADGNTAP